VALTLGKELCGCRSCGDLRDAVAQIDVAHEGVSRGLVARIDAACEAVASGRTDAAGGLCAARAETLALARSGLVARPSAEKLWICLTETAAALDVSPSCEGRDD
jgi:hypothetical protein